MNELVIGVVVLGVVFGGALFGMFLKRVLPVQHLSTDARDVIRCPALEFATSSISFMARSRQFTSFEGNESRLCRGGPASWRTAWI